MNRDPIIIFVCEHGAAKSVIAAAYFNHIAKAKNQNIHAIARGTNPEPEFSARAIDGLERDGLIISENGPKKLTSAEAERAQQIITFCELPEEYQHNGRGGSSREHPRRGRSAPTLEQWDDVPPVSEDYEKARDAILKYLESMMQKLV